METTGQENLGVIHFSCVHCRVSLTVDDSLAGVAGPCPSCGESIKAPDWSKPVSDEIRPLNSATRSGEGRDTVAENSDSVASRRRGKPRSTAPNVGHSEIHRERAEVAAVARMLLLGLVVLIIALAVAFWLKSKGG